MDHHPQLLVPSDRIAADDPCAVAERPADVLALGIALEVKADVALMAGEYLVRAIARRFKTDFGYTKLGLDISLLIVACLLSLGFMGGLYGVREGTLVAALLVGPIVHFVSPHYRFIDSWIGSGRGQRPEETHGQVAYPVITIAREFGSGGHLLGEMLAKDLGISLYDKEFIHLAAQRSGMTEEYIRRNEQSIPFFWLKCMLGGSSELPRERSLSPDDVLFVAESKIVRELSAHSSCTMLPESSKSFAIPMPRVPAAVVWNNMEFRPRKRLLK